MGTGVRQGCCKAPTLWDIFFHFVLLDWRRRCEAQLGECGVQVGYQADGVLRPRRQAKVSKARVLTT
eukprot:3003930-Karenia_brevis.AAC.1